MLYGAGGYPFPTNATIALVAFGVDHLSDYLMRY
jgi:hypothetical protein